MGAGARLTSAPPQMRDGKVGNKCAAPRGGGGPGTLSIPLARPLWTAPPPLARREAVQCLNMHLSPVPPPRQTPHQAAGQPFKFTIPESLDRIKEEFQFLQAQYHR